MERPLPRKVREPASILSISSVVAALAMGFGGGGAAFLLVWGLSFAFLLAVATLGLRRGRSLSEHRRQSSPALTGLTSEGQSSEMIDIVDGVLKKHRVGEQGEQMR